MAMKTRDVQGIDSAILVSAYNKALLYAERKLVGFHASGLLSKITPEDITNEAVVKTLNGKRPWKPSQCPDLFVHLAGCIRSDISNTYTSGDFLLVERSEAGHTFVSSAFSEESSMENTLELKSKIAFLMDYLVAYKTDLQQVADIVLRQGITEPSTIATTLDISVSEANSKKLAIKRLFKRTDFILYYISKNRPDLNAIAVAVYTDKAASNQEISLLLGLPVEQVKVLKDDLMKVVQDIYRGHI